MKTLIAAVMLVAGASGVRAQQVDWCVVTNVGTVLLCLPTLSACQRSYAASSGNTCVAMQK